MKDGLLIDTHVLNSFVTIAEAGSMTEAAKRLGVTQPAVSQILKQLEAQVGTQLVVRRTSPVRLTVAGHVLKKNADAILGELRRLIATVREAADKGLVQCRLGFVTSCAEVFGSKLIAALGHQTERLTLRSGLTSGMAEAFLNREIDVLVSDETLAGVEGLERFAVFRDPMLLAVSSEHITDSDFSLQDLATRWPMIKYGRDASIGRFSEVVLRRMQIQANVRYETDDTHTLMSFVRDGHGWAILTATCLAQTLNASGGGAGVKVMELGNSRHYRTIQLIARKGELGAIPGNIAALIQSILISDILPRLQAQAPWITEELFNVTSELRGGDDHTL
ncbi:LysR family transcriptional regulator [Neptunomonas antarctica]|uniref:DNA-binding transcriptional regulator, LysR family n=1 Tax=Neptunomonas antarctica TaxID=619304 RepID=A0A1N7M3N8_9GAMM|nr:LysR family transcriptional regulator [Neptunomonas antarctica]SIS80720.1 DNA-binding transcriptional regulator, LysR family [Neptunomonas antarctica]